MRGNFVFAVLGFALQSSASSALVQSRLPVPTRELEWKDVNFLSVSDTHGWLLGHQHSTWPEPNYSGDYGDFASFVTHMREIAEEKGVDLLLIDSGDHHDGSGLVSTSSEGVKRTDEIFAQIEYDVLTIGNHELYTYETAKEVYDGISKWNGRYLTSNVNITVLEDGHAVSKPIGERYRKFTTSQGRSVTAFGIIFNFQAHEQNITVQSPSLLASERWFKDVIEEAPDYFVLAGHMPVKGDTSNQWAPIFHAIRKKHPYVPIYIFGGHTHERDCAQYDDHSIGIVPGRYMETIAFTSSSLPLLEFPNQPLDVARRYLDGNRNTYMFHTHSNSSNFDTDLGGEITNSLQDLAMELNISQSLGMNPHDAFLDRYPAGHPKHVNTILTEKVFPTALVDRERKGKRVVICNSGSMRFDLLSGTFDRNDELTLSPFPSKFVYVPMEAGFARKILGQMNDNGATKLTGDDQIGRTWMEEDVRVERKYRASMTRQWEEYTSRRQRSSTSQDQAVFYAQKPEDGKLTMGYVTKDACPGIGDDIEHIPVPYAPEQVDFIQTSFPDVNDNEEIDVVVMDFALDDFFIAIKMLDPLNTLKPDDMKTYAKHINLSNIWGLYAKEAWQE